MKKAFSLLEFSFVLMIFAIIFVILSKPLDVFYRQHLKIMTLNELSLELNAALLSIEKNLSDCNIFDLEHYSCYVKYKYILDFKKNENKEFLFSQIILDHNGTFYAPKSNLDDFIKDYKKLTHTLKNEFFIWTFFDIKKIEILDSGKLNSNFYFGPAVVLVGYIQLLYQDDKIYYQWYDIEKRFKYKNILAKNISFFQILQEDKHYIIKICMDKENYHLCFKKRMQI